MRAKIKCLYCSVIWINKKTILEFGRVPGKNLFGIADKIDLGIGIDIDINGLYDRVPYCV